MRTFLIGLLMLGLLLGTAGLSKAAGFGVYFGGDHDRYRSDYGYNYGYDRDFSRWQARERDRIEDAYSRGDITQFEYSKLNRELSDVEAFHDRAFADGNISPRNQRDLNRMESRVNADINREITEHMD